MANGITLTADPIKVQLRKAEKNLLNITGRVNQFAKQTSAMIGCSGAHRTTPDSLSKLSPWLQPGGGEDFYPHANER